MIVVKIATKTRSVVQKEKGVILIVRVNLFFPGEMEYISPTKYS